MQESRVSSERVYVSCIMNFVIIQYIQKKERQVNATFIPENSVLNTNMEGFY